MVLQRFALAVCNFWRYTNAAFLQVYRIIERSSKCCIFTTYRFSWKSALELQVSLRKCSFSCINSAVFSALDREKEPKSNVRSFYRNSDLDIWHSLKLFFNGTLPKIACCNFDNKTRSHFLLPIFFATFNDRYKSRVDPPRSPTSFLF